MPLFKITYQDPVTSEQVEVVEVFDSTGEISAQEWAEDYAYAMADKGPYTVEELK